MLVFDSGPLSSRQERYTTRSDQSAEWEMGEVTMEVQWDERRWQLTRMWDNRLSDMGTDIRICNTQRNMTICNNEIERVKNGSMLGEHYMRRRRAKQKEGSSRSVQRTQNIQRTTYTHTISWTRKTQTKSKGISALQKRNANAARKCTGKKRIGNEEMMGHSRETSTKSANTHQREKRVQYTQPIQ